LECGRSNSAQIRALPPLPAKRRHLALSYIPHVSFDLVSVTLTIGWSRNRTIFSSRRGCDRRFGERGPRADLRQRCLQHTLGPHKSERALYLAHRMRLARPGAEHTLRQAKSSRSGLICAQTGVSVTLYASRNFRLVRATRQPQPGVVLNLRSRSNFSVLYGYADRLDLSESTGRVIEAEHEQNKSGTLQRFVALERPTQWQPLIGSLCCDRAGRDHATTH